MYIETIRENYNRWSAEKQRDYRRCRAEKNVKIVSLEYESQGDEQGYLCGKLSDGVDWEMVTVEDMDFLYTAPYQFLELALDNFLI